MRDARKLWRPVLIAVPFAVLGVIFLYPFALLAGEAFASPAGGRGVGAFAAILASHAFHDALFATLRIALTATGMCLLLGTAFALLIRFVAFRGARTLGRLIDVYLAFPSFLVALSLTFLYGNSGFVRSLWTSLLGSPAAPASRSFLYGFWGVVLAEVTYYTPFVMRPVLAALEVIDHSQLEVASSLGARPWAVLCRVVIPELLPALIAGGSLCLLLTMNEFGIILVMGVKNLITLPMMIYGKAIDEFDFPAASVVAICNVTLSLGLYFAYRHALERTPQ